MMTEADRAVLDESYRNTRMGREAINVIIAKETPPEDSIMNRTRLWSGIQMNTLLNASTEHLADMMIQGNTRGITELMKTVKKNKSVQKEYYEMAQELMDFEEKNIEKLKAYLR